MPAGGGSPLSINQPFRDTLEAMQATIVEFRKEQGMGRASVDGVGELSFDASVVGVPWTKLIPGQQVQVELGPSRLGGQRILKLWIPGEKLPDIPPPRPPGDK
jgi:hypothetical protein